MSYLYGKKFVGPITKLIMSLREEMYNQPYDQIDWNKCRSRVAKVLFPYQNISFDKIKLRCNFLDTFSDVPMHYQGTREGNCLMLV